MSTVADLPSSARELTRKGDALSGSVSNGVIEETVTWSVPFPDSGAFYQTVLGTSETIPLGNGVTITRRVPLRNPYNPSLFAVGMQYESIDGPGKGSSPYQDEIIKVRFSNSLGGATAGFDAQGNPDPTNQVPKFCKISRKGAGRSITDTARQYSYTVNAPSGGVGPVQTAKLKHDVSVYFAGGVFQVQLFQIPDIDAWQEVVAPLEGCINSADFKIGAFTRAPGTVLLESYDFEEDWDIQRNLVWTGTLNLSCSSLPWNDYLVGGKVVTLSPLPYPNSADLNAIYL